jgi:hypothetical protein
LGYFNGYWSQDFGASYSFDTPFTVNCSVENGFAWQQPSLSGRNFTGAIRTLGGLCLDASLGLNGRLLANVCVSGNRFQNWTLASQGAGFFARNNGNNLCIDVFGQSRTNGTVVGVSRSILSK